jgi:protein MAK11
LIAVSTEDGRIIFYSTGNAKDPSANGAESPIPNGVAMGQLDGNSAGATGRIKDFEILDISRNGSSSSHFLVVTGSSNGEVQIWQCSIEELQGESLANGDGQGKSNDASITKQVGRHLGTYETGNRITCLRAFVMDDPDEDEEDSFEDFDTQEETSDDDSSGSDEQ